MGLRYVLHGGSISLPRSAVSQAWATRQRQSIVRDINRYEVYQTADVPAACKAAAQAALEQYDIEPTVTFGRWDDRMDETSVLIYGNVADHDDAWQQIRSPGDRRKRLVDSGFLHVFISGSGVITVGNKKVAFKRGDVILHNPNVTHSVATTTKYCASVVVTVPLKHAWDKISKYKASNVL